MMTTTRRYETNKKEPLELHRLRLLTRDVFLRSALIAVIIGSILTLINQSGWVFSNEPLRLLPLVLVFLIPFGVVMVAQVTGVHRAHIDSAGHGATSNPEGFLTTIISHGIPARAVAIGVVFGSLNTTIVLTDMILRSGEISAVPVVPLIQAYMLPLLFGLLSQAISYRRIRYQVVSG